VLVTIFAADAELIYYTTDGTAPTPQTAIAYGGAFFVANTGTTRLTAIALRYGLTSEVTSAQYTIERVSQGVAYDGYLADCRMGMDFDRDGRADDGAPETVTGQVSSPFRGPCSIAREGPLPTAPRAR
jgi:hypothetical protein